MSQIKKRRYSPHKLQTFTAFEDWLSRIPHTILSWAEKAMFARLKRFGHDSGEIFPSVEVLAVELGIEELTVRRLLASLEDKNFIERERNKNAPSRFFLTEHPYVPMPPESDLERSNETIINFDNCQNGSDELSEMRTPSLGTEETSLRDKETLKKSVEDLNLDDPIQKFTKNIYSQKRRINLKLLTKEGLRIVERLGQGEDRVGAEEFRRELIAYLDQDSDWLRKNKWPLNGFLKSTESNGAYASARPRQPVNTHPPRNSEGITASNGSAPKPAFDLIGEWNRLVPAMPITDWSPKHDGQKRLDTLSIDEDVIAAWSVICAKVQAIHVANPEPKWLKFHWVVRRPDFAEVANWRRVVRGDFDYLLKPDKYKPKGSGGVVEEALAQLKAGTLGK